MFNFSLNKNALEEILNLFLYAEKKIEQYTLYTGLGPCIHPMNQLRYAGHHLLHALLATSEEDIKTNLTKAKDHCERACYDALEHTLWAELKKIGDFQERLKNMDIIEIYPDYIKNLTLCEEIKISLANNKRDIVNIYHNYEKLQEYLDKLHHFKLSLPAIEQQLNAKIRKQNNRDIFIIAGLIIALFAAIVPFLLKWF